MSTEITSIPWNLLLPILVIQVALQVVSLVSLVRSEGVKTLNKALWAVIIVLFGILGSVLYWILGRDAQ
ncbi:hypothetical protein JCM15765_17110 [Paradesulfitobacterium aromaticivorans]